MAAEDRVLKTGGSTGYVDVPSPYGLAGGLAIGGDGMLYVADTHTLFATPLVHASDGGARFRKFSLVPGLLAGSLLDAGWDLAWHL